MRSFSPHLQVTEREVERLLRENSLEFAPLELTIAWRTPGESAGFDGVLRVQWTGGDLVTSFSVQLKTKWSSLSLQQLMAQAKSSAMASKPRPLVVLPYLSKRHLEQLKEHGLSGLDLSGNCLLLDPPRLFVLRTGAKSRFPARSTAPSVYLSRHLSSIVPRMLLLQHFFPSVQSVLDACHARMMRLADEDQPLALPTVSKALSQLEQDLALYRKGNSVTLSDPIRILDGLTRSFSDPSTTRTFLGKTPLALEDCWLRLRQSRDRIKLVATGRGSASHYTGLLGPQRLQLYVNDLNLVKQTLLAEETVAFPNVELHETQDETVYFDARERDGALWASPIQTYLELSRATARERDVAEKLRARVLDDP